jgi:2-amino-4-hydroxy-6-hydroxymethyldihydropteridine diphosphokinase
MSSLVFISLGGNLGNTLEIFKNSYLEIEKKIGHIHTFSNIYQTAAWGKTDQADFLNQVIQVETELSAAHLMDQIVDIEQFFGRQRDVNWGPRTLDLDILFYEDKIINTPDLTIPHPHFIHRRFVLIPMAEIAPLFVHPVEKKSMIELLEQTNDRQNVRIFN